MENSNNVSTQLNLIFNQYDLSRKDIAATSDMADKINEILRNIEFSKDDLSQPTVFENLNVLLGKINEYQEGSSGKVQEKLVDLFYNVSLKATPIDTLPTEILLMTLPHTSPESFEVSKDKQEFTYHKAVSAIQRYFDRYNPGYFDEVKLLAGIKTDMPSKEQYQKLWSSLLKKMALALDLSGTSCRTNGEIYDSLSLLDPDKCFGGRTPFLPNLIGVLQESVFSLLDESNYFKFCKIIDDEVQFKFGGVSELSGKIDPAGYIAHKLIPENNISLKDLIEPLKQINNSGTDKKVKKHLKIFRASDEIIHRDDFHLINRRLANKSLKGQSEGTYLFRSGSGRGAIVLSLMKKEGPVHVEIKYKSSKKKFLIVFGGGTTYEFDSIDKILEEFGKHYTLSPILKVKSEKRIKVSLKEKAFNRFKKILEIQKRDDFIKGNISDLKVMIRQSNNGDYLITKHGDNFYILLKSQNGLSTITFNLSREFRFVVGKNEMENIDEILELLVFRSKIDKLKLVNPIENRSDYSDKNIDELTEDLSGKPVGTYVLTKSATVPYSYKLVYVDKDNIVCAMRLPYDRKRGKFLVRKKMHSSFERALVSAMRGIKRVDGCECTPLLKSIS